MNKRKPLTDAEIDAELAKLDLMPDGDARRQTDALIKRLMSSPLTPKPKRARRSKPSK
jgi:hypothetical protein